MLVRSRRRLGKEASNPGANAICGQQPTPFPADPFGGSPFAEREHTIWLIRAMLASGHFC